MKKRSVRHGRGAYRALALLLFMAALTACGSGDDDPNAGANDRVTNLSVREYDGERLLRTITLDCAETGGPCDRVVALLPRLAPMADEACAQIYGGPERRIVEGTVGGDPVSIEIARTDGCGIARYDLLTRALRA